MMSDDSQKEIERVISETVPEALKKFPSEVQPQAIELVRAVVSAVRVTAYSGPLPPAEELKRYDVVLPGAADRILTMAENQSKHRINLESAVIPSQLKESERGQWLAFSVAILCIAATTAVTFGGYPTVGCVLGGTTVVGLVTVFVVGKREQKRDLKSKE